MAEGLVTVIDRLYVRIEELKRLNATLMRRCEELGRRNGELEHEASQLRSERDRARLDAEFLTLSHKLADDPDHLVAARRQIAGLIRNIDRCLEMLKE